MKNVLLFVLLPAFAVSGLIMQFPAQQASEQPQSITMCTAAPSGLPAAGVSGKFISVMPGWGTYSYKITTDNDSAQFYFDQGLNLYYSYHMKEALASFREAARQDPEAAMTYWGQALAAGPYYNAAHTYKMPADILPVIKVMNDKLAGATPKEKALAQVMNLRYSQDLQDTRRKELNTAYAEGMKQLSGNFSDDHDIQMLYVDAVMLLHAWDFWDTNGSARSWTPEIVDISEAVLRKAPDHPAALHYHIHLTEASHQPAIALPNAEKLRTLFPGVGHMVHMASHEYQRNGLYAEGVEVNDLADKNLLLYDSLARHLALVKHSPHYFAVQTYCALTGGMYETAMRDALRCRESVTPTAENNYDQYLYMLPSMTLIRLGKWDQILADSNSPDKTWVYASLLDDFAKGLAYAGTGDLGNARKRLATLSEKAINPVLQKRRIPFNAPASMAVVAEKILSATISYYQGDPKAAYANLEKAIAAEDALIYTEPADWPVPARQFLGAFLLKQGDAKSAEKVYRQDLVHNPGNGWSLVGLSRSLDAQHKTSKSVSYQQQYARAFSKAESVPAASVYLR